MTTIQVDEQTAKVLAQQAQTAGISVAEYVRSLVPGVNAARRPRWDEIEQQFVSLSTEGHSLPRDFTRADIYRDHD